MQTDDGTIGYSIHVISANRRWFSRAKNGIYCAGLQTCAGSCTEKQHGRKNTRLCILSCKSSVFRQVLLHIGMQIFEDQGAYVCANGSMTNYSKCSILCQKFSGFMDVFLHKGLSKFRGTPLCDWYCILLQYQNFFKSLDNCDMIDTKWIIGLTWWLIVNWLCSWTMIIGTLLSSFATVNMLYRIPFYLLRFP